MSHIRGLEISISAKGGISFGSDCSSRYYIMMGRNVNEDVGKDMEVFFPNNNGVAHCFHFHNTSLPRHAKLRHWLAHRGVGLVTSNIAQNCPFGRRLTQSFSGFEVSTYSRARLSFLPRETTHGPEHKYFGHGNRIIIR